MAPLEILIVGCSIAGPTLATFLLLSPLPASEKPHITLLERSSALRKEGQNIDIRGSGVTLIRKLGLERVIRASTTGEKGVLQVDSDNRVWSEVPADTSGRLQGPTSDIEILRGRLGEICWKRSKQVSDEVKKDDGAGIDYIFGDYLSEVDQDGTKVHVRFAKSGVRRSFDIVVGADGLQSLTRRTVWGVEGEKDRLKRLGMYGGFFSIPRGETDSDWRRWFHAPGRRGIMLRPDGQSHRTTVLMTVVNETDERLPQLAGKGQEGVGAQKKLLEEYFEGAGWETKRVISEMKLTKDFYYEALGQVKMETWSKGRVVLLGDAGYCASPLSGMGTTLAFNGAYHLAGAILRNPNDCKTAFDEYEDRMRPLVALAQKLPPGILHILNPETAWGIWILHMFGFILSRSFTVFKLLLMFRKTAADHVEVEDYGFKQLPDFEEGETGN